MKYQLTEKIYSSKDQEQDSFLQLKCFFKEFASRKRGKKFAEGLNGGIVIAPNDWAAKINEDDGKAYHVHTNMNLVRFLNDLDDCFDTEIKAGKYTLSKNETKKIMDENVIISLLSTQNDCRIIMFCYKNNHTPFQIETLKEILEIAEEIKDEYSNSITIGFFDKNRTIEEDELTTTQKEKIEKHLNQYLERPKVLIKNKKTKKGDTIYG